jgi:predicted nucleic acid-binding protein
MLVLDASAAVELLLLSPRGGLVEARLEGETVVAPELLDVEVLSALARLERAGQLDEGPASRAVDRLRRLPVTRLPHAAVTLAAWSLRPRVRVQDAFYVAVAALVGGSLLTCDRRLAGAGLTGVSVTLVG